MASEVQIYSRTNSTFLDSCKNPVLRHMYLLIKKVDNFLSRLFYTHPEDQSSASTTTVVYVTTFVKPQPPQTLTRGQTIVSGERKTKHFLFNFERRRRHSKFSLLVLRLPNSREGRERWIYYAQTLRRESESESESRTSAFEIGPRSREPTTLKQRTRHLQIPLQFH